MRHRISVGSPQTPCRLRAADVYINARLVLGQDRDEEPPPPEKTQEKPPHPRGALTMSEGPPDMPSSKRLDLHIDHGEACSHQGGFVDGDL